MFVALVLISAFAVHVVDAMADRRSQKAVKSFHASIRDGLYGVVSYFLAPRFSRNDFTSSDMRLAPPSLITRDGQSDWQCVYANIARWLQSQSAKLDTLTANVRMGHKW